MQIGEPKREFAVEPMPEFLPAYPKELWLLDESMEQLGYIYGVPVRTAPSK